MSKENTRKRIAIIRDMVSQIDRKIFSSEITKNILKSKEYMEAKSVLLYYAFGSEVETLELIEQTLNDQKITLLPQILTNKKTIQARKIKSIDLNLKKGVSNIMEPEETCEIYPSEKIDLIIVPGIAFGEKGERLGYGMGFYDRFLSKCKGIFMGIAFEIQITDKINLEKHDIKMHKIITENRVIDCHKNS